MGGLFTIGKGAWKRRLDQKGQGIVEFALILAFCAAIGYGARETGLVDSLARLFDSGQQPETVAAAIGGKSWKYNIDDSVNKIKQIQSNPDYIKGVNSEGGLNSNRGFIRSQWVDETGSGDGKITEIDDIGKELGATSWLYVNDKKRGDVKPVSLYWTTETLTDDMFNMIEYFKDGGKLAPQTYSEEQLLSFYYDPNEKKYYVIKNHVWMNQDDLVKLGEEVTFSLAAFDKEYEKPKGEIMATASTYEDAMAAYNRIKAANNGSAIFTTPGTGLTVPTGNIYVDALVLWAKNSNAELKNISNEVRLAADQQALINIGQAFVGLTVEDANKLLNNVSVKSYNSVSNEVLVLNFVPDAGKTDKNGDPVYSCKSERGKGIFDIMVGDYGHYFNNNKKYFFSDEMIDSRNGTNWNGNGSSQWGNDRSIRMSFTIATNSDGTEVVESARVRVSRGELKDTGSHLYELDVKVTMGTDGQITAGQTTPDATGYY